MKVFSDLDRSIIYSNKFLNTDKQYENIEVYNGREISYISLGTIKYIQEIQEKGMFIPTTTRTIDQFLRINFKDKGINYRWAITSNGGNILKDGKVLESWNKEVRSIKSKAEPIEEMVKNFEKYIFIEGITKFDIAEDLFFYIVVDWDKFKLNKIEKYIEELSLKNWVFYINGRKIYFLPKNLTKESAIEYLVRELKIEDFSVIGDSTMDLGMLNIGSKSYVLRHGNLLDGYVNENFIVSKYKGMDGSEEILSYILNKECVLAK